MKVVYSLEEIPLAFEQSIFLAGPVSRDPLIPSWRPIAIDLLRINGFDGIVFVPETRDGIALPESEWGKERKWEEYALSVSDCIVFWIQRDLKNFLGLTTNIEFGEYYKTGKIVLGHTVDSKEMFYLVEKAKDKNIPVFNQLSRTVKTAIDIASPKSARIFGERCIPLRIWNNTVFQNQLKSSKDNPKDEVDRAQILSFSSINGVDRWVIRVVFFRTSSLPGGVVNIKYYCKFLSYTDEGFLHEENFP